MRRVTKRYLGTMEWNAPETFCGEFCVQSELFSVGCILYLLVAGRMPYPPKVFDESRDNSHEPGEWRAGVFRRMRRLSISFDDDAWGQDQECCDLCSKLLAFDPNLRPESAADVLSHPWFARVCK